LKFDDIPNLDHIDFLVAKFNSSAVIDRQSNIHFWGDYFGGFKIKTPEILDLPHVNGKIQDLSFGYKHCICLVDDDRVFTWGDGTYGELGHGR